MTKPEVIITGSGFGGATMAAALAPACRQILILERGDHQLSSAQDRREKAIFADGYFRPDEECLHSEGNQSGANGGGTGNPGS